MEVVNIAIDALSGLDAQDIAILRYVSRLTLAPRTMGQGAVAALRAVGFAEQEIHDINQVACCFSYMNRLADGMGVVLEPRKYALAVELMGEEALAKHLEWGAGEPTHSA